MQLWMILGISLASASTPAGDGGASSHPKARAAALSGAAIKAVMDAHKSEINGCYKQMLHRRKEVEGTLTLRFSVQAEGSVTGATLADPGIGDKEMDDCMVFAANRWRFPSRDGGGAPVDVTYPFVFHAVHPAGP